MKLIRDLKTFQLDELKKRCNAEWEKYVTLSLGRADDEDIWKRAFSNGLRAGLEYSDKIIKEKCLTYKSASGRFVSKRTEQ